MNDINNNPVFCQFCMFIIQIVVDVLLHIYDNHCRKK